MTESGTAPTPVRSVLRAFAILEVMADCDDEASLTSIAARLGLAVPTTFRLMRTLVAAGYVQHLPSRRYALGPGLIRLGDESTRRLSTWALPTLEWLVTQLQETANLALLDGDSVVYVAQVPSSYEMRMFTEVGRRVHAHATGVGKAILASLPDDRVQALVRRTGLPGYTPATVTSEDELFDELTRIRARGHAVDDGEQEVGVRCLAYAVTQSPTPLAISISGPSTRMPIAAPARYVEALRTAAERLQSALSVGATGAAPPGYHQLWR